MNIAQYLLRILLQLTFFRYIYIFLSSPVLSYRYHEGVWGGQIVRFQLKHTPL